VAGRLNGDDFGGCSPWYIGGVNGGLNQGVVALGDDDGGCELSLAWCIGGVAGGRVEDGGDWLGIVGALGAGSG
jgi:hypothetical protein